MPGRPRNPPLSPTPPLSLLGCAGGGRGPAAGSHNQTLAPPRELDHSSRTTLREKLGKIGAKVVSHDRYATFQMAEVAVLRDLFQGILKLIDGLRRASLAAG